VLGGIGGDPLSTHVTLKQRLSVTLRMWDLS
jgi:hypothetical protein